MLRVTMNRVGLIENQTFAILWGRFVDRSNFQRLKWYSMVSRHMNLCICLIIKRISKTSVSHPSTVLLIFELFMGFFRFPTDCCCLSLCIALVFGDEEVFMSKRIISRLIIMILSLIRLLITFELNRQREQAIYFECRFRKPVLTKTYLEENELVESNC